MKYFLKWSNPALIWIDKDEVKGTDYRNYVHTYLFMKE